MIDSGLFEKDSVGRLRQAREAPWKCHKTWLAVYVGPGTAERVRKTGRMREHAMRGWDLPPRWWDQDTYSMKHFVRFLIQFGLISPKIAPSRGGVSGDSSTTASQPPMPWQASSHDIHIPRSPFDISSDLYTTHRKGVLHTYPRRPSNLYLLDCSHTRTAYTDHRDWVHDPDRDFLPCNLLYDPDFILHTCNWLYTTCWNKHWRAYLGHFMTMGRAHMTSELLDKLLAGGDMADTDVSRDSSRHFCGGTPHHWCLVWGILPATSVQSTSLCNILRSNQNDSLSQTHSSGSRNALSTWQNPKP